MTKKSGIILGAAIGAIGAAAGLIWSKIRKSKKQNIPPVRKERSASSSAGSVQHIVTNFKDADHLILCEESQLNKRIIQLENTINMRDIGGYTGLNGKKVKWGKVLRSEELNEITDNDVAWLEGIGLKHIFDFRDESKSQRTPDRVPKGTVYHNLPTLTGLPVDIHKMDFNTSDCIGDFFKEVYAYQVREKAAVFAEVLKTLARDETPVLFHCTNGKDRTGFMAALILLICGVTEESILSDYTLTNLTFDKAYPRFAPVMAAGLGVTEEMLHDFFGVRPEWLKIQLNYIRENYDNVDDYLIQNTDLTSDDLDHIRDNLLEKEA